MEMSSQAWYAELLLGRSRPAMFSSGRLRRRLQAAPSERPHSSDTTAFSTRRKTAMKTRAAVALEKANPLQITEVELDGPKVGEVLVEVKATGICHTDEFPLSGADPEGLFPAIL